MKILTAEQMRAVDQRAMQEYGIPGAALMEAAGAAFARACIRSLGGEARGKRVVMLCGRGNNGGDGFVAARYLLNAGATVTVYLAGSGADLKDEAAVHYRALSRMQPPWEITEQDAMKQALFQQAAQQRYDLIGDAVLGTGARAGVDPKSLVGAFILWINNAARAGDVPVVACDVPSGVDTNSGAVDGPAVKATRTVTFARPKPCLVAYPGVTYAGAVEVADIGIPHDLLDDGAHTLDLLTVETMQALLPRRSESRDSNKGTFGTLLVVAGSAGMAGAAVLTALSALRAGAGLVQLAVPNGLVDTAAALAPEVIVRGLPETSERLHGGEGALEAALRLAEKADAVALGPGIGGTDPVVRFVQEFGARLLYPGLEKPLVVDADGLNALAAGDPAAFAARPTETPFVLTPHPGEMGRLLGMDAGAVQADRQEAARRCAEKYKATALLKGARTLIASNEGRITFNRRGSVALATAGSGDVLTGVVGAFLAGGLNGYDAARAGAYVHALAGELCERDLGTAGVVSGDVRDRLPQARERLYHHESLDEL